MKQVGGLWTFFSGDLDMPTGNGLIDVIDYSEWEADYNNFESGYRRADLNGDGVVDISDYPFWEENYYNFVVEVKP
jgi:hypothetical protein